MAFLDDESLRCKVGAKPPVPGPQREAVRQKQKAIGNSLDLGEHGADSALTGFCA